MTTAAKKRPLYQELRNRLAQDIATGRYPVGGELPSLAEMSAMYEVSPGTVSHVIAILGGEGLIRCHRGRRPRVQPPDAMRRQHYRIAILLDCPDRDGVHDYADGPWNWTLHQALLRRLLEDHNPALNLSYRYDWTDHLDNIDGVIAMEAHHKNFHEPDKLLAYNIPCVRIAPFLPEPPAGNTITLDYAPAVRQIATYFIAHGVKHFFINDIDIDPLPEKNRFSEFRQTLSEHKVPAERIHTHRSPIPKIFFQEQTLQEVQTFLREHPEPVGALLAGDLIARQFVDLALQCGRTLKKDIFAVGISGLSEYAMGSVALSSIDIPFAEMANRALELLYGMIRHKTMACPNISFAVKFHPRAT